MGENNTKDMFDPAWAISAREGDKEAFEKLYVYSYRQVYITVRSMILDDEEMVRDVLQDTYLKAFRAIGQYDTERPFLPWINAIARNTAIDYLRKEKEMLFGDPGEYSLMVSDGPVEEERFYNLPDIYLDRAETVRMTSELLGSLTDEQRIVISMVYYQEMTMQQVADTLEISLDKVKKYRYSGEAALKDKVLDLEKEEGYRLRGLAPIPLLLSLLHSLETGGEIPDPVPLKDFIKSGGRIAAAGAAASKGVAAKIAAGVLAITAVGAIALYKPAIADFKDFFLGKARRQDFTGYEDVYLPSDKTGYYYERDDSEAVASYAYFDINGDDVSELLLREENLGFDGIIGSWTVYNGKMTPIAFPEYTGSMMSPVNSSGITIGDDGTIYFDYETQIWGDRDAVEAIYYVTEEYSLNNDGTLAFQRNYGGREEWFYVEDGDWYDPIFVEWFQSDTQFKVMDDGEIAYGNDDLISEEEYTSLMGAKIGADIPWITISEIDVENQTETFMSGMSTYASILEEKSGDYKFKLLDADTDEIPYLAVAMQDDTKTSIDIYRYDIEKACAVLTGGYSDEDGFYYGAGFDTGLAKVLSKYSKEEWACLYTEDFAEITRRNIAIYLGIRTED